MAPSSGQGCTSKPGHLQDWVLWYLRCATKRKLKTTYQFPVGVRKSRTILTQDPLFHALRKISSPSDRRPGSSSEGDSKLPTYGACNSTTAVAALLQLVLWRINANTVIFALHHSIGDLSGNGLSSDALKDSIVGDAKRSLAELQRQKQETRKQLGMLMFFFSDLLGCRRGATLEISVSHHTNAADVLGALKLDVIGILLA
ncbi:hypothetical protein C8R43DRAFT_1115266 [Mycena crocata]|nr:hypothetical protein C8R43DRAFT_1115266 [Mycena crocata]